MISSIIQALFIKIQSNMSEQQRIYDLLNTETKPKVSLSAVYKAKKNSFLRKKWSGDLNKKGFLTALTMAIKKDPIISIKKHVNELKVYDKTVRTAMKQDLSPDLDPLYTIWGVLENKTNATSHQNREEMG